MIILETLKWSNAFSYGPNNKLVLNDSKIVQFIGKNGHGKSSIALILEEVLYNKNSKGIKKSDILNRKTDAKSYTIELSFSKDLNEYLIQTIRGVTQTVKLHKNGEDISAHTSTATYKLIEDIIGFDHKTFTQIVYQSSIYSLEFLSATDTNRKKFLIDLLNLSVYTKASEILKEIYKVTSQEAELLKLKIQTISDWLIKFNKENLDKQELLEIPVVMISEVNRTVELEEQLRNIEHTNKKVLQNNKYKEIISNIDISPVVKPETSLDKFNLAKLEVSKVISNLKETIAGTGPITDLCIVCGQFIDNSHKKIMLEEAKSKLPNYENELKEITRLCKIDEAKVLVYKQHLSNQQEWEKYHSIIDRTMSSELLNKETLALELTNLEKQIKANNLSITSAQDYNNKVTMHNTKVDVLLAQLDTINRDSYKYNLLLQEVTFKANNLQILVKTFSTTGLVAYKIECLVKDLEQLTNEYLLELSDGRFQLSFKVNSSDKLNVIINDNGKDIDILALSNGERGRVNLASLLAIRKLMQTLSNSRINLLILDETIESLDVDGKDKLIEVLLKEEYLNTILVSHGFNHPLLEKVSIIKENNISRIE